MPTQRQRTMELTIGDNDLTGKARKKFFGGGHARRFCALEADALCGRARHRTGLEDFGDPPLEPALSTLLNSLQQEAELHQVGRFLICTHLLEILETRLRLVHAWRSQPKTLAPSRIERPIFITGLPRSGSSFLHELLAQDPD